MNAKQKQAQRKQMRKQRLIRIIAGVSLLLTCALIVFMASKGNSPLDREASAVVFLIPIALILIFAK